LDGLGDGLHAIQALVETVEDLFTNDNGIINEDAKGDDEGGDGHHFELHSEGGHEGEAEENGGGNEDADEDGEAPAGEDEHDHEDAGEGLDQVDNEGIDGGGDVDRLVEHGLDFEAEGEVLLDFGDLLSDVFADRGDDAAVLHGDGDAEDRVRIEVTS